MRFLSELRTYAQKFHNQRKVVNPRHPPNNPRLQHSQVNDPTRPCKKSQTANRLSSTHEYLWNSFIRQTNIWELDYNSFHGTYSLRWRHQDIMILKVKYSFCLYFPRKNFVYLDLSLKRSVTCVLHVRNKSSHNFAYIFSFEFLNIMMKSTV